MYMAKVRSAATLCVVFVFLLSTSGLEAKLMNGANEFYIAFSANGRYPSQSSPPYLNLYVTTSELHPVEFIVSTLTGNKSYTVSPDHFTTVTLDYDQYSCQTELTVEEKGIYISAEPNKTISVYGRNYRNYASEMYLALPCERFPVAEYVYYSMSISIVPSTYASVAEGFALIVACEDSTVVSTPTHTVTLNRLQTYLFRDNGDITGIRFESNNPIVLMSGHECGCSLRAVSCFYNPCCGPLVEQIPPTLTWGTIFLTATLPYSSSITNTQYRILASSEDTHLHINCSVIEPVSVTVTKGIAYDLLGRRDDVCVILTDKPVLVAQFGVLFYLTIPSIELYLNTYSFYALSSKGHITIAMLAAPWISPETTQLYLDDKLLVATWTAAYALNQLYGYVTTVKITSGHHYLFPENENAKILVTVHDYLSNNYFYGYPAGYTVQPTALSGYCDPPCIHGECIHGGECSCSAGYRGEGCNQSVSTECYENSCNSIWGEPVCSKMVIQTACECPQDFEPHTCNDFWNSTCNCTSIEPVEEGCSVLIEAATCPTDASVCLSETEGCLQNCTQNCTRFILRNFKCNCTDEWDSLDVCEISCPSHYSTLIPPVFTHFPDEDCLVEPCINGGTCQFNYYTSSYSCHCPYGYHGSICQYKEYNYNDDYDDSSGVGASIALLILVPGGSFCTVCVGCPLLCYFIYWCRKRRCKTHTVRHANPHGHHNYNVIQHNALIAPREEVVPLIPNAQMLPDEFDWSLGPPRPRAVQEDHRGQMVPIAAVNDLIEPFLQQQDERWQDEIGCAVIPLMNDKPLHHHLMKLVAEDGTEIRIIEEIAATVEQIANALQINPAVYRSDYRTQNGNVERVTQRILERWLDGEGRKPVTWVTLIQAIKDAGIRYNNLVAKLENTIRNENAQLI